MKDTIDVIFSFDTTGSMYPCLAQVRKRIESSIRVLFNKVDDIRVGIIAHGDYCDAGSSYVIREHELTRDIDSLIKFVRDVGATGGGDSEECYELVLHQARGFNWQHARSKALVVIGDDVPHGPSYRMNTKKLDWRNEIDLLLDMGVNVYGVQALGRRHANHFYEEIARKTGGCHLQLDQFESVNDLLMAICYKQVSTEALTSWEEEVHSAGRMNRAIDAAFAKLQGRTAPTTRYTTPRHEKAADLGRFQVMHVDMDSRINDFVRDHGVPYVKGRGFYEFTKREIIQDYKEVIVVDNRSGDIFSGDTAREMLHLPVGRKTTARPEIPAGMSAFVQSTSYTRKLQGGTRFLYEVDMSR